MGWFRSWEMGSFETRGAAFEASILRATNLLDWRRHISLGGIVATCVTGVVVASGMPEWAGSAVGSRRGSPLCNGHIPNMLTFSGRVVSRQRRQRRRAAERRRNGRHDVVA